MLGGYRNPNDCACLKDLCLLALPRASKKREAQTRTIATSATSFSATVVISGASFMPMPGVPKDAAGFGSLEISRVARTQGPAVRQRSEPRGSNGVQGNVGEPIGRANLVAKSPAVANGRAAHARSSFSYAARIVTARPVAQPVAEVDYCSETWSEWQDLNLRPPRPERCGSLRHP